MSQQPRAWQQEADRLAHELGPDDAPTAWLERLYAGAASGAVTTPWDRSDPHPLLEAWTVEHPGLSGRAVQVGCGLGADAEHLAGLGLATTAFDISPTVVELARSRHPGWDVDYRLLTPAQRLRRRVLARRVRAALGADGPRQRVHAALSTRQRGPLDVGLRRSCPGATAVARAVNPLPGESRTAPTSPARRRSAASRCRRRS